VPQISPSGSTQSQPERPGPETPPPPASSPGPDADDAAIGQEGFLTATLAELRRVVWPSRQQLFSESIAVILMVGLSAASIAALDRFYRWVSIQVFR
jgi:preprotein translocase subunit SecE